MLETPTLVSFLLRNNLIWPRNGVSYLYFVKFATPCESKFLGCLKEGYTKNYSIRKAWRQKGYALLLRPMRESYVIAGFLDTHLFFLSDLGETIICNELARLQCALLEATKYSGYSFYYYGLTLIPFIMKHAVIFVASQKLNCWSLGMVELFNLTLACNYLQAGVKFNPC